MDGQAIADGRAKFYLSEKYRVKSNKPLLQILELYAQKREICLDHVVFSYHDRIFDKQSTPRELGMTETMISSAFATEIGDENFNDIVCIKKFRCSACGCGISNPETTNVTMVELDGGGCHKTSELQPLSATPPICPGSDVQFRYDHLQAPKTE